MPRLSPRLYRRITAVALWSLAGIIVTGASVRLTGSGLGCSDWPTCEHDRLIAPFEFHAQVEFINRLITGLVSISVIAALAGSLLRTPRRPDLTRWSLALIGGVIAQIVIGGIVTLSDLKYSVVAVHFLVSMVLVWAAVILCDRAAADDSSVAEGAPVKSWSRDGRLVVGLAGLVLLTGPAVTSAGPHAGDAAVERLHIDLVWTARVHGLAVWLLCASLVVIAYRRRTVAGRGRPDVTALLGAVVVQGAIGYTQYFSGVPPLLVGIHVAGAILVWVMGLRFALADRRSSPVAVEREPVPV